MLAFVFAVTERTYPNLFWQISDGIAIVRDGHLPDRIPAAIESGVIVAHEWLFEILAGELYAHGMYAVLILACAVGAAATPLLVYALARANGCASLSSGIAGLLAFGSRYTGSALRPETFAVDFFAVELLIVARALPLWCALPVAVLWANIHASAVLSVAVPAVISLVALATQGTRAPLARRAGAVAILSAAGTLINPYGIGLWLYAWGHGVASDASTAVLDAWKPLSFSSLAAWTGVFPGLVVFAVCGIVRRRGFVPELTVAALFVLATILHERYAVFLAVAWAVPLARSLDASRLLPVDAPQIPRAFVFVPAFVATLVLCAHIQRSPTVASQTATAAAIAAERKLSGHTYADIVWASYLTYRGLPLRILIDGHGDQYPPSVWRDAVALQRLTPGWTEVLDKRGITVVIVDGNDPIAQALAERRTWHLVERRDGVVAYVRSDKL